MNNRIGCDKNGNCTAKSKDECWRYSASPWPIGNLCEYMRGGKCKNVHALEEAKENERKD